MKILLAEDDRDMARAIQMLLIKSNYSVEHVDNGSDAIELLLHGDCDIAILDIMMPHVDGLTALKKARKAGCKIPVMMLTAMGETDDKITGLDAGADDYLAKPFDAGELLARVRALSRRVETFSPDIITYAGVSLDRNSYSLSYQGNSINLGNKAFQMMEMLMLSPSRIISVNEFMEHIWGWDSEAEINVVWVNISQLRKHLEKIGSSVTIRAVRGAGYTLEMVEK